MSRVVLNIRVSEPNIILYNRLVPVQTYYGVGEFLCVNSDFDADYMASLSIFGMCNGEVDCHLECIKSSKNLIARNFMIASLAVLDWLIANKDYDEAKRILNILNSSISFLSKQSK